MSKPIKLQIIFMAGTFGNFLKFFLEKFSTLSPDLAGDPFTDTGTSHTPDLRRDVKWSGTFHKAHLHEWYDENLQDGREQVPICAILPSSSKDYLYLKKAHWYRAGDSQISPDWLWQKPIGEMPTELKPICEQILSLYQVKEKAFYSWIPKFIVRDFYKKEFLAPLDQTENFLFVKQFRSDKLFKDHETIFIDLEAFFRWETFQENIKKLDENFGLQIDWSRSSEMQKLFQKGYDLDTIRQECNLAQEALNDPKADLPLNDLDVSVEAYIYAEMEKKNDFVQMPLTNRFFRDTAEMNQFIEFYPNHYKAMNPNMPKFNGIANPFYLDHKKKR